jgi:uncharacterized protein (TIGR00251 family)
VSDIPSRASDFPARAASGGIVIHLRVTPKASSDAVLGVEHRADGAVLKVKVRALPDKGEANEAVIAVLAKWLGEPKAVLSLAAGGKSRSKQIFVAGEPASLMTALAARIADAGGQASTKQAKADS